MKLKVFVIVFVLFACLAPLQPAKAQFNGNPIGGPASASDSDGVNTWTSTLDPNPAQQVTQSQEGWILNGLVDQGFNSANGWTIKHLALQGTLTLEDYYAWVLPGFEGGLSIQLQYSPAGNDPTGAAVDWIQAVWTDDPLQAAVDAGVVNDYDNGYYSYLDNEGTYRTNPDYDNGVGPNLTTSTSFEDNPSRVQPPVGETSWEAEVFIDTVNVANKTINIYDAGNGGVLYGFDLTTVPETSSTFALLGLGTLSLLACDWRRRMAKA